MLKRIFPIFLLILLPLLSSCSVQNEEQDVSWQDDIIYATECGLDGMQCCLGEETLCLYEQECCIDPSDPKSTYCADACSFGEPNTFCRGEEPRCDEGSVCFDGYCQIAGGNEQPCFIDNSCKEGVVCSNDICVECGLVGSPCCDKGEYKCKTEGAFDDARTGCIDGTCLECGFTSRPSCITEPYCNDGHLENNSYCLLCGGYNQPCCNNSENDISFCNENESLKCRAGFCLKD